jgi:hypothetical protein
MRRSSAFATRVPLRKRRFLLVVFFVRMWLLFARPRRNLPVPVVRIRFAAPRFDFILGISLSVLVVLVEQNRTSGSASRLCRLFQRRHHHRHHATLEVRMGFNLPDVRKLIGQAL